MRNQYDAGSIAGTVLIIKLILFFQFTTKGFSIYVTTIILEVTKMENKIDHIIARVLAGEASAEDILFISNWMNEKEENHKTFSLLKSMGFICGMCQKKIFMCTVWMNVLLM